MSLAIIRPNNVKSLAKYVTKSRFVGVGQTYGSPYKYVIKHTKT